MNYEINKKYLVSGKDTNGNEYLNNEMRYIHCDDLIEESYLHFIDVYKGEIIFHSENVYKIAPVSALASNESKR